MDEINRTDPHHDLAGLFISGEGTEGKQAEEVIRKLAAFPRFNPNPVLEMVAEGKVTYANDAAVQMARSMHKEEPGALLPFNAVTVVKQCLSTGQNRLHVRNSVQGKTLSWSFFPILSHQVVHCYAEDITETQNLEAQVRQMQKMESVGQLAAGIAHDFNNILTVIQGHAGLILAYPELNPLLAESAKQIAGAAERAAKLTRQLLTFSRKQVMQPQLLDLNEVITNVAKMLRSMLGEGIKLQQELTPQLPPIHADVGMLEQVLMNLAVNARDAMPEGGSLLIRTHATELDTAYIQKRPEARAGYFVCISVSDTGAGMPPEVLNHIFEPFYTTKASGKGTGLGLSTAYGIVKQHRGWMEVESEVGQGTTFRILLPASCKARVQSDSVHRSSARGGKETILVVEDESSLRELVQEILRKKGYTVFEASTGTQALQLWADHRQRIDLLLTDLMMPEGLSGRDLAQKVLAEKPELKVLYTSGYNPETLHPGFAPKEGVNFLQKPYHPEMLAQVVRNCLDGGKMTND